MLFPGWRAEERYRRGGRRGTKELKGNVRGEGGPAVVEDLKSVSGGAEECEYESRRYGRREGGRTRYLLDSYRGTLREAEMLVI